MTIYGERKWRMLVRQLTIDHFDADMYDLWWRFLTERQRIWVRRAHLQLERPWTTDRTLNYEFITNVYRELDPGTEYVLDVVGPAEAEHIDVIFNIMLYRLTGSQVVTHQQLGFQQHDSFDKARFVSTIESMGGHRVFGDAYRVAGMGEGPKINNIGDLFEDIATQMPELYRRLLNAHNARDMYNIFESVSGFGSFLSNQCMVDVLMLDEGSDDRRWSFGTDEWCQPGPGARRGIVRIIKSDIRIANGQMVMAWLRDAQEHEFEARDLDFPYLLNRDDTVKRISLCNIQTCLCEFQKYVRARGRTHIRAYHSQPSLLTPFDISLDPEQIEGLRDITACTPAENSFTIAPDISETEEDGGPLDTTPPTTPAVVVPQAPPPVLVPDLTAPPVAAVVPAAVPIHQSAPTDLASLIATLQGLAGGQQMKPMTIPLDPQGIMGMPRAVLIVPIY